VVVGEVEGSDGAGVGAVEVLQAPDGSAVGEVAIVLRYLKFEWIISNTCIKHD
jgi:hypothetical protein